MQTAVNRPPKGIAGSIPARTAETIKKFAAVAQFGRAPGRKPGRHRFDPCRRHHESSSLGLPLVHVTDE